MGAGKQTIGFKYYFSLHMGLGRGPLNEIAEIRVGGVTAYDTSIDLKTTGQLILIDKPDLFGGEKKEGGIQGPCYVYNGAADQELQGSLSSALGTLPAIADSLGGDVPNFRGVVSLWFDGLVAAMNPYPKEWAFRVRRSNAGWWNDDPWYPAKARIIVEGSRGPVHGMNGAHILYEVNTNPEWGRGMPPELIDEDSFVAAANTLCAERLALCLPWYRQENIKEFIPVVIDHIGGVQYLDRETGKLTLRLIRDDYDPDDLPLFTPDTGLLDLLDDDASSEDTAYNEIVVEGFDPSSKEPIQVRVQNLAAIQSQGEIISNTIQYKGFPTTALCARVAQREIKLQLPLRRMTVVLDRRGWRVTPGMPFRVSDPRKGIENLILRAGECRDGTLTDGKISVKAVQDVFGMPETSFVEPPVSGWTPPVFTAVPSPESLMYELNWRDFYLRSTTAEQSTITDGTGLVGLIAKDPPGVLTQGYDVYTKADGGSYATYATVGFTNWLTLAFDMLPLDVELDVTEDNLAAFSAEFTAGMVVMIDEEHIQFVSFDPDARTAAVKRGVADTIPAAHEAGKTIWLIDDEIGTDNQDYADGEVVYGKALTRTSTDVLDESEALEVSVEVNQRLLRPYPPANVKVGGLTVLSPDDLGINSEPALTWTHRNKITQGDVPVGHTEASVTPETDLSYRVRVYTDDGVTLLREDDLGLVDSWTYDSAMQAADGDPSTVVVELESLQDGLASQFLYRFPVVLIGGWGYDWGNNWGGD